MPKSGKISQSARYLAVFFCAAFLTTISLFGQTAARIEGTVQDPNGAVVANAKISALNVKTQAHFDAVSSDRGQFILPSLPPGIYTMTVESPGFQKQVLENVEVNVGAVVAEIIRMKVGQLLDTITVEANALTVQTTSSEISRQITIRDIDTLPQLGRTPITLAAFQPGIQLNPGDVTFSHVNGQRQGSNNSSLDGIDVNDSLVPRLGLSLTANNTDSVGEFRIVTEGGKAEYGRSAGAQVDLVTRTGTNNYHGSAFDYLRNTDLNANDYFSNLSKTPRPKFIQNIFGGSFGGPIQHDKTFIFGNYQGRRTKQEIVRNRQVLSTLARQGIFQWKDSSGVHQFNIGANDPRHVGVDPQMAKLFALVPAPNNLDTGDGLNTVGFRFNNPNDSYEDQFTIRGDHNVTNNIKAFLRWSWQRNSSIDSLNNADATYPGQPQGVQGGHRWGFAAGSDWTISNSLINEFRAGHQSSSVVFARPARLHGPTVITNLFNPDPINSAYAQGRNSPVNEFTDNMTKVHGDHAFRWGGNVRRTLQTGFNDQSIYQNVTTAVANGNTPPASAAPAGLTSAQLSTFQQLYNDVLGRMDAVAETFYSRDLTSFQAPGTTRQRDYLLTEMGYYFQDDWKLSPRLTINAGLRWEYFGLPHEKNGIQATVVGADQVTPFNTATALTAQRSDAFYNKDWNNFAPRLGFAWDVKGDGKTAIRGNYGVFYDRNIGAIINTVDANTPGFSQGVTVFPNTSTTDIRVNDGVPLPQQPAAPVLTVPVTNRTSSIVLFNPNLRSGYVDHFALSVQREVLRNTILEVGYVGTRGVKLFMDRDLNQMKDGGQFLSDFKEIQAFQANGTAPSAGNLLVKMFGTPATVISSLGASNFTLGNIATAANTLDRSFNSKYAAAGLPQTFMRNYPQFNQAVWGSNDGRSYYDALQMSLRRSTGLLKTSANYTYSKGIDNISIEGNGFAAANNPVDNFNLALNRARGDFDHRHSFNSSVILTLPFGKGQRFGSTMPKWLDTLAGGWEVGTLFVLQDGAPFTVYSSRATGGLTTANTTSGTWANFAGTDKNIGSPHYNPDGSITFFTPDQVALFSFPTAGSVGNSGRNAFRGPRFFNVDSSLVKRFKVTEKQAFTFRAEAYNMLNNPNFPITTTNLNLNNPTTLGKIQSTVGGAQGTSSRVLQLALRYDF
ncbi:MAG: carboxypeptidase regulatory-like domain-containing protein [Terriglobales bacterium]